MNIELVDFIAQGPWAVALFLWMRRRMGKQDVAIAEIRNAVCPHKPTPSKVAAPAQPHDDVDTDRIDVQPV